MSCRLKNNTLEILGLNKSIAVFIEVMESLSYPLSLQASQHLRELRVREIMSSLLAPTIQRRPLAVPVKGYTIRTLIQLIQLLQILVLDEASIIHVEEPERNLVLGIRFRKEVLEGAPVQEVDLARLPPVGDSEEDAVLFALDLVLWGPVNCCSLVSHSFAPKPKPVKLKAV